MAAYGGFSHNEQTLRILTHLEHGYAEFDGLNLTWEALEGTVKHNGPLASPLAPSIAEYDARHKLDLDHYAAAEAQVAALADDIAYNNHDIDDGLRAGLFTIADLAQVPLVGPVFAEVAAALPRSRGAAPRSMKRFVQMIDRMVRDMVAETRSRLLDSGVKSADEIRALGRPVAAFSDRDARITTGPLKRFLYERMYRHYRVNRMKAIRRAGSCTSCSISLFARRAGMPAERMARGGCVRRCSRQARAHYRRLPSPGMTDRFALDEHRRLFDTTTLRYDDSLMGEIFGDFPPSRDFGCA